MKKKELIRSVKAKGLKRGFEKEILGNDFKKISLNEKPLRLTQKQIKSKNFKMTMEYVEKDVVPLISNKRESLLGVYISFPW